MFAQIAASRRPCAGDRGFTLVELLVVIVILGTLVALLAPAVQSARETARQVECKNNIKQLSLACHSHHDVHGSFPTGGWGWYWVGDADRGFGKDQPGGWIYNLLPYFEQYAVYGQASDGNADVATRQQRVGAAQIIQTPLSVINCPSRRANTTYPMSGNQGGSFGYYNSITPDKAGRSDYAINSGHVYAEWPDKRLGQGPKSYGDAKTWNAAGYWGGEQEALFQYNEGSLNMTGISFERSIVSIRQVVDGLSQTYLLGEKHVPVAEYETGVDMGDNETWCTGFNNDNYRRTGRLSGGEVVEALPVADSTSGVPAWTSRFGSSHPTSWNVAYCDGSVRQLTYDLDWQVHRDSGNREDGLRIVHLTAAIPF